MKPLIYPLLIIAAASLMGGIMHNSWGGYGGALLILCICVRIGGRKV